MVDSVKFEVKPKNMPPESKMEAIAKEAKRFVYNGDLFELENPKIKTADCFILLKDGSFGNIKKIIIVNEKVFIIVEQSHKTLRRMS